MLFILLSELIKDPVEVKSCLQKACDSKSLELVEFWLGTLNSLYSDKAAHNASSPKLDINVDPQSATGQGKEVSYFCKL